MRVIITIDCDNAAFEGENLGPELSRILDDLSDRAFAPNQLKTNELPTTLYDVNGNACGIVEVQE